MLRPLLALLVPASCLACRGPTAQDAELLCPACRAALPWLRGPCCPRCALPAHRGGVRCPAPAGAPAPVWAPLAHGGPAAALVHAHKHRGVVRAAGAMAAAMAANAPPGLLAPGAVLVPVPADPWRRRARGHDHTATLAREVAERSGLPVAACLRRTRAAPAQVGRSRAARLAGPAAVAVRDGGSGIGHAVLVDDVHTTGATLAACARALRAAGVARVAGMSYARALSGGVGVSTV